MPVAVCPRCQIPFHDPSGQYAAFARLADEGRLGLMIGCTSCRMLFVPVRPAHVEPTDVLPTDTDRAVAPTQPLEGRYRIEGELGRGGMGVTLRAYDTIGQRPVCIKRLHARVDTAMLRQEWRALAALDHPSIVRMLDFYEGPGAVPHLVMELVDGVGLDTLLGRGAMQEWAALDVVAQLADALDEVHQRFVIHRDLKPANILLAWQGSRRVPRLVDFGLAIVDGVDANLATTGLGHPAGTPLYMPPEQILGARCTPSVDVFSLGVTLVQMLVGTSLDLVTRRLEPDGIALPPGAWDPRTAALVRAMTRTPPDERPSPREVAARAREILPIVRAPAVLVPTNLTLERVDATGAPVGWFDGAHLVHGASRYAIRANAGTLTLAAPRRAGSDDFAARGEVRLGEDDFGVAMQRIPATHLAGKRLVFSAELTTETTGWAGLWLRADGADGSALAFDNMSDRPRRGTSPPAPCSIGMAIPAGTAWLNYGVLLVGSGHVRVRSVTLAQPAAHVEYSILS